MEKNIIGDWGADLTDVEYGRALAALGVLEAEGKEKYPASDDPHELTTALRKEFEYGERTVVWRNSCNSVTIPAFWRETIHGNAPALAKAWEVLLENDHPRRRLTNDGGKDHVKAFANCLGVRCIGQHHGASRSLRRPPG